MSCRGAEGELRNKERNRNKVNLEVSMYNMQILLYNRTPTGTCCTGPS